jgi:hypothetical protein
MTMGSMTVQTDRCEANWFTVQTERSGAKSKSCSDFGHPPDIHEGAVPRLRSATLGMNGDGNGGGLQ